MTKLNFRKIKWPAQGQIIVVELSSNLGLNSTPSTSAASRQAVKKHSPGPGRDDHDCLKTCRSDFLIGVKIVTDI